MRYLILFFLFSLIACNKKPTDLTVTFVSHGMVFSKIIELESVTENNVEIDVNLTEYKDVSMIHYNWKDSAIYSFKTNMGIIELSSPKNPLPYTYLTFDLENVDNIIKNSNFPDIDVAFSLDNQFCAIGTYNGFVRVYKLASGEKLWEKKIAEGMAKKVVFTDNNEALIVGEQSHDAKLYAFDILTGKELWSYRTADDIESSSAPKKEDMYGIYSLPAIYQIKISPEHNILVSALHSWFDGKSSQKKSKLYSFDLDGKKLWEFPKKEALRANIQYFDNSLNYLSFTVDAVQSEFLKDSPIKESSVALISVKTGELLDQVEIPVLKDFFDKTYFWQAIAVQKEELFVNGGTADGRAFIIPINNGKFIRPKIINLASPELVQGIPIMSSISFAAVIGQNALFPVNETSIPYSYSVKNKINKVPAQHPNAGSIYAFNIDSALVFRHQEGLVYSSLSVNDNQDYFLASIDDKTENREKSTFGFALFKHTDGKITYLYTYQTNFAPFFRAFISADGTFKATALAPEYDKAKKEIKGKYQVIISL
jgi:WD40 repeat protein